MLKGRTIFMAAAAMTITLLTACGQSGMMTAPASAGSASSGGASAEASAGNVSVSSPAEDMSAAMPEKNSDGYTIIDAATAKGMLDKGGVILVDVRRADEYAAKHIPDAINVPNESIGTEKPAELPDTSAVILVYCRTGIRAADASAKLAKMGYTNIYDMGGITTWPYETVTG